MNQTARAFLLATLIALTTACGQDADSPGKPSDNQPAPPRPITAKDLIGQWQGDFDATWTLSKEAFLKDTLRGTDAYPDDPAERERIIREEIRPIISGMRWNFQEAGKVAATMMGEDADGEYEVLSTEGQVMTVKTSVGTRTTEWRIEFADDKTIRMTNHKDRVPTTLVLQRQRA